MQKNTSVTLGSHLEQFVSQQIAKGRYGLSVKQSGQDCGFWKNMKLALKRYGRHLRKAKIAAGLIIPYLA